MAGQFLERRKYPRFNLLVDVNISRKNDRGTNSCSRSRNISQGGICFIAYERVRELDVLNLEIVLPDSDGPINVAGKVVWVREFVIGDSPTGRRFDVGVEFLDIAQDTLDKIKNYLFTHPKEEV